MDSRDNLLWFRICPVLRNDAVATLSGKMNNGHNIEEKKTASTVKLQHRRYILCELASKTHETQTILFVTGLKPFANNIMKSCQHSAFIKQTLLFRHTITTQVQ
jgi:hypothetical protein